VRGIGPRRRRLVHGDVESEDAAGRSNQGLLDSDGGHDSVQDLGIGDESPLGRDKDAVSWSESEYRPYLAYCGSSVVRLFLEVLIASI
jgi:hypothetical protein